MDPDRTELTMKVDGMTCDGCADSVRRTIRRLDPEAEITVDLLHGRVTAATRAQSLDITQALDNAGYGATAVTG